MTAPLAVQLYSVREALARDFDGVVRQIADMGYAGVETAGFPGTTPQAAARLFQDVSAFCVDVVRKALQRERDGQKLLRYAVVQLA